MKRRNFITLLGGTAVAGPLRAFAQTPAKIYRVGLLGPGGLTAGPFEAPLIRGLAQHGYVPDGNLAFDRRGAGGHPDHLRACRKVFPRPICNGATLCRTW